MPPSTPIETLWEIWASPGSTQHQRRHLASTSVVKALDYPMAACAAFRSSFVLSSRFWKRSSVRRAFAARPSQSAETRYATYGYDLRENKSSNATRRAMDSVRLKPQQHA